ncbi:MAG: hypothetical protein JWO94_3286 [Verrucomicrobiaceae bacterium]|nr:hypothetical protein [Verrucomicrobiaceae bacterium]
MPVLSNPKAEACARLLAADAGLVEWVAYARAFGCQPKSARSNASTAIRRQGVRERAAELRGESQARGMIPGAVAEATAEGEAAGLLATPAAALAAAREMREARPGNVIAAEGVFLPPAERFTLSREAWLETLRRMALAAEKEQDWTAARGCLREIGLAMGDWYRADEGTDKAGAAKLEVIIRKL